MDEVKTIGASIVSAVITTVVVVWPFIRSTLARYEIRLKTVGIQQEEFTAMKSLVDSLKLEIARLNDVVSQQETIISVLQKYLDASIDKES